MTLLQKRWKSIRSCYTRELLRLKGVKSGSAATRKKQYTYFEQLRFLETAVKKTTTNLDEENNVNEEESETSILSDSEPTCSKFLNKSKKRSGNDHELIEVLKKKIASEDKPRVFDETDEDKLFLLSMLTEIHKVPAEKKLKLRADMISLVAAAQTPVHCVQQGWQQMGYTGLPNPTPPPSMYTRQPQTMQIQRMQQQYMLQRPMEEHHIQQQTMPQSEVVNQQPQINFFHTQFQQQRQDANMPLQSPTESTSLISNEDSDTQMSEPLLFNI